MKIAPKAKTADIIVQTLGNEKLIYNLSNNKTFCLNETSSIIWKYCNGKRTVSEISHEISIELKNLVSEDIVWLALDQFRKDGLLENGNNLISKFEGLSRREVIKKVGFASVVALPIVSSLVAPEASMAQSLLPNNSACTTNGQCASGNCLTTPPLGTNCCASGVVSGQTPTNNVGCVATQPACTPLAATNCCSGTATVATTMGGPLCPPAGFACICN